MSNYILYLAEGNNHNVNECRYSLLKYLAVYNLKPPTDIGIIVYTDVPATFEAFEPFFNQFELKEIKSPLPSKLEIFKEALSLKQGNFLYVSTDSYFIEPVDAAFQTLQHDNFLFYKQKATTENDLVEFKKIKEYLSNNSIEVEGEKISYLPNEDFYSTEIIGTNSATASLVQKMYLLYSEISRHSSAEASETFACSYYATNAAVQTMDDKIISYRNFPQFKNLLQLFFKKNEEESIPNLVKLVHHIDAETILQEKKQYDGQPFVKKLLSALTGRAWSVRQYQNKF